MTHTFDPDIAQVLIEFREWLTRTGHAVTTIAVYVRALDSVLVEARAAHVDEAQIPQMLAARNASLTKTQAFIAYQRMRVGGAVPGAAVAIAAAMPHAVVPRAVVWAGYRLWQWATDRTTRSDYAGHPISQPLFAEGRRWQKSGWPGKRLTEARWAHISQQECGVIGRSAEILGVPPHTKIRSVVWQPYPGVPYTLGDYVGDISLALALLMRWGQWPPEWYSDSTLRRQMPLFPNQPQSTIPFDARILDLAIRTGGPYERTPPPDDF